MKNTQLRTRVLLALQVSLLGMVSTRMNAVLVYWDEMRVSLRLIFDNQLISDDLNITSEIETQMISHFPDHLVSAIAEVMPKDKKVDSRPGEIFVFLRRPDKF